MWNVYLQRLMPELAVAPHCRTKIQRRGLDPHLGCGDGLRVGMGGFRDQKVETGRFRYI